jgi:hypothetical protein
MQTLPEWEVEQEAHANQATLSCDGRFLSEVSKLHHLFLADGEK